MLSIEDLEYLKNRVTSIQNSQNSLRWGFYFSSCNDPIVLSVGHRYYRGNAHYLMLSSEGTELFDVTSGRFALLTEKCYNPDSIIKVILTKLREWFPAR